MLFNSIEFAIFLPLVFGIYWILKERLTAQNWVLLISSYLFYGWWDWRFLSLILFSSLVDYLVGLQLGKINNEVRRKWLLAASIIVNLGFLGFFKYFDFFIQGFAEGFTFIGVPFDVNRLNIILPVGISFYTFQTLSYSIDVYRRKLEPTQDALSFFAFVSFFPQLVAGPIERATNLLPQFFKKRKFDHDKAVDGCRQILWGLFKKIAIADNCAIFVNDIFATSDQQPGSALMVGAVLFSFQIYCDFSGYSDIAIGTSRLFGFNLKRNFNYPYFSRDIAEFWRRWHISLSTWFRDYLYIPLGGSKGSKINSIRNVFVIFIVSGFWHGANWTFIFWGFLNGLFFLPLLLSNKNRTHIGQLAEGRLFASFKESLQILFTFSLVTLAWVFFRAENLAHATNYLTGIFSISLLSPPDLFRYDLILLLVLISFLLLIEWLHRNRQHGLHFVSQHSSRFLRWSLYYLVVLLTVWFSGGNQEFIYFQF